MNISRSIIAHIIVFLAFYLPSPGQDNNDYLTITYFENDTLSLELDYYKPDSLDDKAPLVIFMHGGGFSGGNRSYGRPFCQFMADSGIHAATISYSLNMKGRNFSCEGERSEKIRTIQLAAFQARIATDWFIRHAGEFQIDTSCIFLAGSSAGAEAVLQAAFWDTGVANYFPDTLSDDFTYAGVISGAGALLDINMINKQTAIPVICYHGTCDPLVPYHIAPHHYCNQIAPGFLMMFGGLAIHEKLGDLGVSSQLMTYCNEGHTHAGTPFNWPERYTVLDFIQRTIKGEYFYIHRIFNNGRECNLALDFPFCY